MSAKVKYKNSLPPQPLGPVLAISPVIWQCSLTTKLSDCPLGAVVERNQRIQMTSKHKSQSGWAVRCSALVRRIIAIWMAARTQLGLALLPPRLRQKARWLALHESIGVSVCFSDPRTLWPEAYHSLDSLNDAPEISDLKSP